MLRDFWQLFDLYHPAFLPTGHKVSSMPVNRCIVCATVSLIFSASFAFGFISFLRSGIAGLFFSVRQEAEEVDPHEAFRQDIQ